MMHICVFYVGDQKTLPRIYVFFSLKIADSDIFVIQHERNK
jgi:hypothetical protein